jgi:hypothetical protein
MIEAIEAIANIFASAALFWVGFGVGINLLLNLFDGG